MPTPSRDLNRTYARLLVERGLLSSDEVDAALERLAAPATEGGASGSAAASSDRRRTLLHVLLEEGRLQPEEALAIRAAADGTSRRDRENAAEPADRPTETHAIENPAADASPALTPSRPGDSMIGKTVGGCRLLERIGEGGMGTVYRAQHLALDKTVAIKILPPHMVSTAGRVDRFRREARAAARIEHPNVVQILNVGEQEHCHYIIMQFIEGEDLRQRLIRRGVFPIAEVLEICRQVATGLQVAHQAGIIHRDIKPDNIMIDPDERVKITDFGLAKALEDNDTVTTKPGKAVGTPYYMSPEQCSGQAVDARSDIYSLGATLYHVLTGQRPFKGETPLQTALKHLREPLKPASSIRRSVPAEVDDLLARMMAKKPEGRPESCAALLSRLDQLERRRHTRSALAKLGEASGTMAGETVAAEYRDPTATPADVDPGVLDASATAATTQPAFHMGTGDSTRRLPIDAERDGHRRAAGRTSTSRSTSTGLLARLGPQRLRQLSLGAILLTGVVVAVALGVGLGLALQGGSGDGPTTDAGATPDGPVVPIDGDDDRTAETGSRDGEEPDPVTDQRQRRIAQADRAWAAIEARLDRVAPLEALAILDQYLTRFVDLIDNGPPLPASILSARTQMREIQSAAATWLRPRWDQARDEATALANDNRYGAAIRKWDAVADDSDLDRLGLSTWRSERDRTVSAWRDRAEARVDSLLAQVDVADASQALPLMETLSAAQATIGLRRQEDRLRGALGQLESFRQSERSAFADRVRAGLAVEIAEAERWGEWVAQWPDARLVEPRLIADAREALVRWRRNRPRTSAEHWVRFADTASERASSDLASLAEGWTELLERLQRRIDRGQRLELRIDPAAGTVGEVALQSIDVENGTMVGRPVEAPLTAPSQRYSLAAVPVSTMRDVLSQEWMLDRPRTVALMQVALGQPTPIDGEAPREGVLRPYRGLPAAVRTVVGLLPAARPIVGDAGIPATPQPDAIGAGVPTDWREVMATAATTGDAALAWATARLAHARVFPDEADPIEVALALRTATPPADLRSPSLAVLLVTETHLAAGRLDATIDAVARETQAKPIDAPSSSGAGEDSDTAAASQWWIGRILGARGVAWLRRGNQQSATPDLFRARAYDPTAADIFHAWQSATGAR